MDLPTPDSLIAFVKPTLDSSETFLTRLAAVMADEEAVKFSYRGGGLFTLFVEGYLNGTGVIEVTKALIEAGYQVHGLQQQVGYLPPAWWHDSKSAGHDDPGVTGTSQTPWFVVSISKAK